MQLQLLYKNNTLLIQVCISTSLLGDCLIEVFHESVFAKTEKLPCKRSMVYEMQSQIEEGPVCLCFSLFPKRSITDVIVLIPIYVIMILAHFYCEKLLDCLSFQKLLPPWHPLGLYPGPAGGFQLPQIPSCQGQ